MFVTATIVMLPFVSYTELMQIDFANTSTMSIVYLAIVPTAFASLVRVKLVQKVGVQFMSQVAYLIPIFAIFWAWLFLSELPSINAWIALCLILLGLFVRKIKE
jgi:drug/metabolite transporter (DMT)-like permease